MNRIERRARVMLLAVLAAVAALIAAPGTASADPAPPYTVLFNQASARCPDGTAGNTQNPIVCDPGHRPGTWQFNAVPGAPADHKTLKLDDRIVNYCLEVVASRVTTNSCDRSPVQEWIVTPFQVADAPYDLVGVRLKSVANGLCLDNTTRNFGGWRIYLFTCNDGPYQQWDITREAFAGLGQTAPTEGHSGMTWRVLEQRSDNIVHVGSDSRTNPYKGDTYPSTELPVLCRYRDGRAAPSWLPLSSTDAWAWGEVKLTPPIAGSELTSRARGDEICASSLGGTNWRMAEFHNGGGWSFWANGTLPNVRFWTAIDDQPANPWD
ncbi:hypothetical protein [Kitasatospora sp. NPDC001527]|uniref:hypothetical protein n=1 Tax=Kitasatospora sp. NPDC001527 TaxID=3154519 RepID=UPI003319C1F3